MVSVPKFTKNSTFEECIGVMSPVQRDMFILIDEYWKKFQYSPTLRELAYLRGKMGIGNYFNRWRICRFSCKNTKKRKRDC